MKFSARPSDAMIKKYSIPATANNPNPPAPDIGTVWIEFLPDSNVGIKQMRNFAQYLSQNMFHTGILITHVNITPAALKIIPAVASETKIECFLEQDLLVNITHHELVSQARAVEQRGEIEAAGEIPSERDTVAAHPAERPDSEILGLEKKSGGQDHSEI